MDWKSLVLECHPEACCTGSRRNARYAVTVGRRVLGRGRSARHAWKQALRAIVKGW